MFSFARSGAIVTGVDLSAGFCACAPLQLTRIMASTTKAIPVFFMVSVLLEVRAFCAFIYPDTATTPPVRIKSWQIVGAVATWLPHFRSQIEAEGSSLGFSIEVSQFLSWPRPSGE